MRRIAIAVPAATLAAIAAVLGTAAGPGNGAGVSSRGGAAWSASRTAESGGVTASLFDDVVCAMGANCATPGVTGTTVNGGSAPGAF